MVKQSGWGSLTKTQAHYCTAAVISALYNECRSSAGDSLLCVCEKHIGKVFNDL